MEEENKENKKEEKDNENKTSDSNNHEENLKKENIKEEIQNNKEENSQQKEENNKDNQIEQNKEEDKKNNEEANKITDDKPEQNIKNEENEEKKEVKKEEKDNNKGTTDNQMQNEENKIIEKEEAITAMPSQNSNQENKVNDNSINDNLNNIKKENNETVLENKDNSQKNNKTNESNENKININTNADTNSNTDSNNENNTAKSIPASSDENKNANEDAINDNDISPEELKKLYNIIHSIITENKKLDKVVQEITSMFDSITEHLISGDRNDSRIFELFGSLNFIYDIVLLMNKKNKDINTQIIKFFSILFTNLSDKHINYFIFNCDFINQHIYSLNESINPDYLYYYISFVKSLILKINTRTIEYFYHARTYSFPLLCNCLKFYNHPDSMISNTARNIFLVILKIKHQPCIDYICTLPMLTYFIFLSCRLRDEIRTLNKKLIKRQEEDCAILMEDIINDIMYIEDIFSINIEKVNYILINCIFHYLIIPVICNSIVNNSDLDENFGFRASAVTERPASFSFFGYYNNNNANNTKENHPLKKYLISAELTLYILNIFMKYIKNETFINLLLSLIFLPDIHIKIINKLKEPLKDLENYQGDYNDKGKKKITFEKYVIQNFCPPFIRGQISNQIKLFSEFDKIEKKLIEKCKINKIRYDLNEPIPYGFLMEILYSYFSYRGLRECREYHEIVSESTGIQCGLTYHKDRKSFIYLMNKNLRYIKNNSSSLEEKNYQKYVDNEIYRSFINLYKDCNDSFLLLCNFFFHQILTSNICSKELLAHIKLLNPAEIRKNILNKPKAENTNNLQNVNENGNEQKDSSTQDTSKDEKKGKKKFKEVLTFSNLYKVMYKKDFSIKDFNLYNNKVLSDNILNDQTEYNTILLGDTISYLNKDEVLKPETYLFIIRLINNLMIYEENNEKKILQLRGIHRTIIKFSFSKNIEKIKKIINERNVTDNDLKMIFIFLWGNNSKLDLFDDYDRMITNIMKDCSFLLSKYDDDNIIANENNETMVKGLDIFNSLLISDEELRVRIYFLKGILKLYNLIYQRKESDIEIKELNEQNNDKTKEIMIENFDKLIIKENAEKK